MENYEKIYKEADNIFGDQPEKILTDFIERNKVGLQILDIGAGQGRNAFYAVSKGFKVNAVEPSKEAVDFMTKNNKSPDLKIVQSEFANFITDKKYDLILIFGLLQILSYNETGLLVKKVSDFSKSGSLVMITIFSVKDDSYKIIKEKYEEYRPNYFKNGEGKYRSFPSMEDINNFFKDYNITGFKEYTGPMHRHGKGEPEKHEMIEMVLKKK